RQVWLSQAGAAVTAGQFWAVCAGLAAAAFVVLFAVDRTVIVAAVPALAVGAAPYGYWSAQRSKRSNARFEAWPDGLRHVTGALRAGIATLHEALIELSVSGPDPLRAPMARYVRLADRVGSVPALEAVRAELADPISDTVLLTFELATEEGTTVVLRVLDGLLGQITGDLALGEKVRTSGTQSRIAAWGSLIIPYGLLVFLSATTVAYRQFYASGAGLAVVIVGACGSIGGFAIVRRLARPIATTERVFTTSPAGSTAGAVEATRAAR
ncbi:MAG: type II secretion system F family protein, partial [Acidimicrobiales bacterium]